MNFFWLFNILVLLGLGYLSDSNNAFKGSYHNIFRVILILLLGYYAGIGSPIAEDHEGYATWYMNFTIRDLTSPFQIFSGAGIVEYGYVLLNVVAKGLNLGETGFFFLVSVFINALLVNFIYKHRYPVLSLLFLFSFDYCIQEANLVRQMIALAIMLNYIDCLKARNVKKYIIGVLIASLFHLSALLFLIFIPICFMDLTKKHLGVRLLLIFALIISVGFSTSLLSSDFLTLLNFGEHYSHFDNSGNHVGTSTSLSLALFFTLPSLLILLFLFNRNWIFTIFITITAIVANVAVNFDNFSRVLVYFLPIGIVYIIQYLDKKEYKTSMGKNTASLLFAVFALYCGFRLCMNYIFVDKVALLSKTLSWSNFFLN